jgi:nucleotide-binding universal stress UspA family protein
MKLQTIVVGIDLSAPSLVAARWVVEHFAPDARLVLVHASPRSTLPSFLGGTEYERLRDEAEGRARDALSDFAETLGNSQVETVSMEARPAEALLKVASDADADLLVVGAHRRRAVVGSLLGSTASRLLGGAPIPVLLAHGLPPGRPRRILAAVDASEVRSRVLAWTGELARAFDAQAHVVYAVESAGEDVDDAGSAASGMHRRVREDAVERASEWLDRTVEEEGLDPASLETSVGYGRPQLEIVAAADRLGADLIVMGSRGRGRAGAAILGSVARGVLEISGCPVLVVPSG